MTWTTHHRRGEVLRTVVETADERRDGLLPTDVDGVRETFRDDLDLLAALQLKWHTRLAGRIDARLGEQPVDLGSAVERAWVETAEQMPGVRAVLDHYRTFPDDAAMAAAMAVATSKEHMMLAATAGRASVGDPSSVPVGAAVEARARASREVQSLTPHREAGRLGSTSLLRRLKSLVAA